MSNRSSWRRMRPSLAAAALAGLAGIAGAMPLTFSDALSLAERQSPLLAASAARIDSARLSVIPAGALPDPRLVVGLDNVPASGPARGGLNNDPMTMQRLGLMQEIPSSAKRRAREELARAGIEVALAEREVVRREVRRDAALAWLGLHFLARKLDLFSELERENEVLAAVVQAQIAGGRAAPADVVAARIEAVRLADRRDDITRDMARARAVLRRLVGAAADDGLAGGAPDFAVDAAELQQHVHLHPELRAFETQRRKVAAEAGEARAAKAPDWGVELDFQRRSPQFGNMVSVQFTYDLPLFASRRQDPQILARERELDRIDAEREAMLREHASALDGELADLAAASSRWKRSRISALPLAQEKVDLVVASYQAGKADLGALLAARRELIDARMRGIDLEAERETLAARLAYAYGEDAR
jgi:cobalt-zinc-cadmium efflux system outer membrane protein